MSQPSEETRAREELRKAFVEGSKWLQLSKGVSWWLRMQKCAEAEAKKRYGDPEGKESE